MSSPVISKIVAAVPHTLPCSLTAKIRVFQADICAAHYLFMKLIHELVRLGGILCDIQTKFPEPHALAHEKARLLQCIRTFKTDMDKIHYLIDLLLKNSLPSIVTCVDFWCWAEWRFRLLSSVEKHKG